MSVIVILLLPLVATALVCLPFRRQWAAGVTVVSCLTILVLAARVAWLVSAGNSVTAALKVRNAEMDCGGRIERADSAADCLGREHRSHFLGRLHGA